MYELVNTSAEKGLVALSSGFTTVEMTRGMDEGLRVRLEAFCAYQHRTNAHDESFYRSNPVNWFHVVDAQAGHIMGRVGPCEFDYTGRTNRLARLWVLEEGEWPCGKSAADILSATREWFAEAWAGEVRYLEADSHKVQALAQLEVPKGLLRWREVFGARGEEMAQRVAWQLEKNLMIDARTIFFRTSAEWDVSGEKLLGLFAEVIRLLPEALRGRVTFATYPAAMPNEVACALRGSWDADGAFAATASSQAWVDCVAGRIMNEELLPTAGMDWAQHLDQVRKENAELKEMLKGLQAANATLDKECARVKSAQKKLEEEHAALRKEHEKLKCTLLMATGKLHAGANERPMEGGTTGVGEEPRSGLENIQIRKAPRRKWQSWAQADTGLKLIMASGLLIVSLIILGVVMIKYSEELSLRSHVPAVQGQGERR